MSARPRIAYYAHHHGSGHLRHAARFARLGIAEVLVLGTRAGELEGRVPGIRTLALEPDDAAPHAEPDRSPFHWTPRTPAVRRRFEQLHEALAAFRPDAVLVDVSVEAAAFSVLAGWRTALRRMPGRRDDRAHEIAYDAVDRLFAYYPQAVEDPAFAAEHRGRVDWLGMAEPAAPRAAARADDAVPASGAAPVVVLAGTGGDGLDGEALARAARSTPGRPWVALGRVGRAPAEVPPNLAMQGHIADPRPLLAGASAIVAGGGHNTVAAAAAARRPTVLIPEPRPFDEQAAFARRVSAVAGVPMAASWEEVDDWPALLAAAHAAPATALARTLLVDEREFAARAAGMLGRLLDGGGPAARGAGAGER